jgi:hypothetical protein
MATNYEVIHQTVVGVADPAANLVQLNAPAGKFIVSGFSINAGDVRPQFPTQLGDFYGLVEFVFDGSDNITGAVFRPIDTDWEFSFDDYEAYIVCVDA